VDAYSDDAAATADAMMMNPATFQQSADFLRTISAEALLQALRSRVVLTIIDVRERAHIRDTGAIAGARTYPWNQLGSRLSELDHLRATRIVVVSQRARRAHAAAHALEAAGFGEVFVLEGGMHRWLELGHPVEARPDSAPPSLRP
jgi:rhodanese-related sulfurtransferase